MTVEMISPPSLTRERSREGGTDRPLPVQVFGGGKNSEHFGSALKGVRQDRPVELFEVRPIDPELVPHDVLYRLDEPEGRQDAEDAMGEGALAAYLSLVPRLHMEAIEKQLRRVGEGLLKIVIVAKPAVQTVKEMRQVDLAITAAKEARRSKFGKEAEEFDPLYVHEHYIVKGAWSAFREQLGAVMDQLGRLESATINIEEARTVESEGRVAAFEGGALEDFGPHVSSLGFDVEEGFANSKRFSTSHRSKLSLERYRYTDSALPENVETGFIVRGMTTVTDDKMGKNYDLPFTWQGGKGLEDKKYAELRFVHPDTGIRTRVTIDLQKNTIDVPEEVAHLFPQVKFSDNGYGAVVKAGLNGGSPDESFRDWDTARKVIKFTEHIRKQNTHDPIQYLREGQSLDQLSAHYS